MAIFYQQNWPNGTAYIFHVSDALALGISYRLTECAWIVPGTVDL